MRRRGDDLLDYRRATHLPAGRAYDHRLWR